MIRPTVAYLWTCATCHDTGYAATAHDAEYGLTAHHEDYH